MNHPNFFRRFTVVALAMGLLNQATLEPARGINIIINLDDEGENPSSDPTGSKLLAIANAAASIWEDYLPESGDYEVDIAWSTSDSAIVDGALGVWYLDLSETYNNVYLNATLDWFIDSTPLDHSEFNFEEQLISNGGVHLGGRWLFGDLDPGEQSAWFDGSIPDGLEVGYRGRATSGSAAAGKLDLLSTVIHELGHELGVNGHVLEGDWAISQYLPSGTGAGAEVVYDDGHFMPRTALMCDGCGVTGTRRLPSAVDIMAVGDDEGFTAIDLPRKDFHGTGSWTTTGRWYGRRLPDANDHVFLRGGAAATLSSNDTIKHLTLSAGTLELDDGILAVLGESKLSGLVTGSGMLRTIGDVEMSGTIRPVGGSIELDIAGTARLRHNIDATSGNFTISGTGNFVGPPDGETAEITIGNGRVIDIQTDSWTLGSSAALNLNGGTLRGQKMFSRGDIANQGTSRIEAPVEFQVGGSLNVGPHGNGVVLAGSTTYAGGSFTGTGTLVQQGNAVVTGNTTIRVTNLNLDGGATPSTLTINDGRTLTLDVEFIDATRNDYNGTANVAGTLDVALRSSSSWRMEGTLNLTGGRVIGRQMVIGDDSGVSGAVATVNSTGTSSANSVVLEPTGRVNVNSGTLSFNGLTQFDGGSVQGVGTLQQNGEVLVTRTTQISVDTFDMDGSRGLTSYTIGPDVALNVLSESIDQPIGSVVNNSFNGNITVNGGTLNVRTHGTSGLVPWSMEGNLFLNDVGGPATVSGSMMIVEGLDRGPAARVAVSANTAELTVPVEFTRHSELSLNLAGSTLGSFGRLMSGRPIELDGHLELVVASNFLPTPGMSLEILRGSSITGRFNSIASNFGSWTALYGASVVRAIYQGILGDLNGDNQVDALDAGIMFGNWGSTGAGDLNGDGVVDAADAGAMFGNWTGDASSTTHPVPEPTSMVSTLIGVWLITKRTRKAC